MTSGLGYRMGRRVLSAIALIGALVASTDTAVAQQCVFPQWYGCLYNCAPPNAWTTSSPNATAAAAFAVGAAYNPAWVPQGTVSCTISGNANNGGAAATCTQATSCLGSSCVPLPGLGTPGQMDISVQESCLNSFYLGALPQNAPKGKNTSADPINPEDGSMFFSETDVSFPGATTPLNFRRFYATNSQPAADLAPNWTYSYSRHVLALNSYNLTQPMPPVGPNSGLYTDPADACVKGMAYGLQSYQGAGLPANWVNATGQFVNGQCLVVARDQTVLGTVPVYTIFSGGYVTSPAIIEYDLVRDDGSILRFPIINGVITAPVNTQVRLSVGTTTFTVTDENDTVEVYNASGTLQSVTTRSGIVQTMHYTAAGYLAQVTDSFGNSLTLARSTKNLLTGVTVNGGGSTTYQTDSAGRLSVVTFPDTKTRTYVYENTSFPNQITGLIDESTTRLTTWSYDSSGRTSSSVQAGGANSFSLNYKSLEDVEVTDPLGQVRTFTYSRIGDYELSTGISGGWCPTCVDGASVSYDAYGFVASRVDYNGNLTCYLNSGVKGQELVRVEGLPSGSACPTNLATYTPTIGQRKVTTAWHPTLNLPTVITEASRITTNTYDGSGNLLTRVVTDTTVTPNTTRTWTYTYNGFGQVLTAQLPRTDVTAKTTYQYYTCTTGTQCGHVQTIKNALGQVTTYNTYNAYGQPLTITDPNGVLTTLTYDARQRLTSVVRAGFGISDSGIRWISACRQHNRRYETHEETKT